MSTTSQSLFFPMLQPVPTVVASFQNSLDGQLGFGLVGKPVQD
jgi:hypothetical protein